ncbi:hypothetical protein LUZ60_002355 [Juncus effusus]|nr:hypothetical protein LUZ60_002355 [Juncus effusus]
MPSPSLLPLLSLPSPPPFATLLSSFASITPRLLLCLFNHLPLHLRHDAFTLSSLSKSLCNSIFPLPSVHVPFLLHSLSLRCGFLPIDAILTNSLVSLYLCNDFLFEARKLFDEMPVRTVSSYNTLISFFSKRNNEFVLEILRQMQYEGFRPDGFTVSSVLPVCWFPHGREIHGFVIRNELNFGSDFHVSNCLINMYFKAARVDLARKVFDEMPERNVVNWTAMIGVYVSNEKFLQSLNIFREMQIRDKIFPNRITLVTILPSIGSLVKLPEGKSIHSYSLKMLFSPNTSLNNALIDMYSKCGSLNYAQKLFDDLSWQKDSISWTCMISSYGLHGKGEESVKLFYEMLKLGFKPDNLIALAILSACSRSVLVEKGLQIFNSLIKDHSIEPSVEIYACLVDLLGKAGEINRALDIIKSMPIKPTKSVWGALFKAAIKYNNEKVRDLAYENLIGLEGEKVKNPSDLISVSNLHASCGRWDLVENVRNKIMENRLKKLTGSSWIS